MSSVAVLLSTYNGAKFLKEQIESIINQDFFEWKLYIRDDGSSDDSIKIIREYVQQYQNIYLIADNNNLGSAMSFISMLEKIDCEYYMFCDQDDKWFSNKISFSLQKIKVLEKKYNSPALVFSDAMVSDAKLNVINKSFWNYNKSFPTILLKNPEFINVYNCAPGCTIIFNNRLKIMLNDYDNHIIMHDWYIMIKAFQCGYVDCIHEPLMFYRQHINNVVGAEKISGKGLMRKIFSIKKTFIHQYKTYKFVSKYYKINFLQYYYLKLKFTIRRFKVTK
ncbi:glycosyltransferase family 2 protein [Epilithonimonas hominis]|uniref:Glycosyltransferase involved in cell wall bisynthesis n=1 Tax=Epilithonimonas hominis TaxID=420404 RepID=A0A1H6KL18_9FLAO|nr:glycosyltransferase family 2 protein [Epilithonimonas hominis]SEH76382.1 Glycosyltransferase involved in cell wall bisynthesis [Epilithonimonas hominis]